MHEIIEIGLTVVDLSAGRRVSKHRVLVRPVRSAVSDCPWRLSGSGTLRSSTSSVIAIANTPSLNASRRLVLKSATCAAVPVVDGSSSLMLSLRDGGGRCGHGVAGLLPVRQPQCDVACVVAGEILARPHLGGASAGDAAPPVGGGPHGGAGR